MAKEFCQLCKEETDDYLMFDITVVSPCYDNGYGRVRLVLRACPVCMGYTSRIYRGNEGKWPNQIVDHPISGALGEFSSWGNPENGLSQMMANAGYDSDHFSDAFGEKHGVRPYIRTVTIKES